MQIFLVAPFRFGIDSRMPKGPHPRHVSDITPDWLTEALREGGVLSKAAVASVDTKVIGEGVGFLSSVGRIQLRYDRTDERAPSSVVIKIEPERENFRELGDELHAFEREIRFYREVANRVPIRLARVYFSLVEPPDYALVMEDLSFCTPGDQVRGMHTDQVIAATRVLAHIQAAFWDNQGTASLSWMPRTNAIGQWYRKNWSSFVEYATDRISPEAMAVGERVGGTLEWLEAEMRLAPPTIVHGDLRADNLLFGPPDTEDAVFIVDWQIATRSMGAFDVARLLGGSEPPAERRGHQLEVLRSWHNTLTENGVDDYSWDDAVRHLRIGTLAALEIPVAFHEIAVSQGGRGIELMDIITRRMFTSALEIDAVSVLP